MTNSINTNVAALFAQSNLTAASANAASSVQRLSSGNAIVQASDNVAALATGTSLQSQVSALKAAQGNVSQGSSLLQVADGALSQIQSILQQQQAIALQAGSGSLTNTDRGFLNQEFQALTAEINSLASSTTFNGVNLIDGSLSQAANVTSKTSQSAAAAATVTLNSNDVTGDTFVIGGVTLTASTSPSATTDFQIGATAADTIANLATKLNALASNPSYATTLGKANFVAAGNTLNIIAKTGGSLGDNFTLNTTGTANKAAIGGQYGGSTVSMFATGFASSSTAVTAATSTANSPFQAGDAITATVGEGTAQSLYTVVAGDTLTSIVNGINSKTASTGVSAALAYDPTTSLYNIKLHSNNATGAIAINGGSNFFNTDGSITHALNGATETTNLFTAPFAAGLSASATVVGGGAAATPFTAGDDISVSINGGASVNITVSADGNTHIAAGDTLANLVTKINANTNAKALGIHAAIDSTGKNISLTYSDATQTAAMKISGGANFYNVDATGASATNGLNSSVSTIQLFQTGFADPATTTVVGTSQAAPFVATNTLSVIIPGVNGGASIALGAVVAADKLQDIAKTINASAGAKANGIHAEIVTDNSGLYNIQLSVASSTPVTSINFNPGAGYNGIATRQNLTSTTDVGFSNAGYESSNLFTDAFASTLTAGSVVVGAAASATTPFKNADNITVTLANGTALTAAAATGDKLSDLVTKLNTSLNGNGVYAALNTAGNNIVFNYSNASASKVVSVNGGANFYNTDATGAAANNGINTRQTSIQLFSTGFANASTVVSTATAGTAAMPLVDGVAMTVTIPGVNGGSAIAIGSATPGSTLTQLAATINASAGAITNGIHAQVITDASGKANIQLNVASGGTVNPTVTFTQAGDFAAGITSANLATSTALVENNVVVGTEGAGATHLSTFGLAGGKNDGLGYGSTSVSGTVGDSLLTNLNQSSSKVLVSFPAVASAALTDVGNFNSDGSVYLSVAGHNFAFTTTASTTKAADEITIGSTLQETLDNAVSTINSYLTSGAATGDTAFQLNQLSISREGNTLTIEGKGLNNPTNISGGAASTIAISAGFTNGATVSNAGALNNGSNGANPSFGVDTSGLANQDFNGLIGGFTATYSGPNTANVSVKVGAYTYTASAVNTSPTTGNETVRFISASNADGSNGGYFDVQLAQNHGVTVNGQTDANQLATRFNAAFSSLNFNQERLVSSYVGTQSIVSGGQAIGSLIGSSVSAQLPSFAANKLTQVTVTAPKTAGADAQIALTIDGQEYVTSTGLGYQLGANQTYRLTSTANPSNYVDFTTGNTAINMSSTANASAVQTALSAAFGTNTGAAALSFQIGSTSKDTIAVSIGSATSSSLFNGQALSVSTQADAVVAAGTVADAINAVTALRSGVGALESQFNFATAALQSSVQNQDAARGQLLDTDIAAESTAYATQQVKLQAGISVLAQANQQLQQLLKLIG